MLKTSNMSESQLVYYTKSFSFNLLIVLVFSSFLMSVAFAHGVDAHTKQFLLANRGIAVGPFLYIGAKHMVTGYDHLLFLLGVIFFLFRTQDIVRYVSLFTLAAILNLGFSDKINPIPYPKKIL